MRSVWLSASVTALSPTGLTGEQVRDLDRRAVELSVAFAAPATPDQLDRPTPCAGWTLGDLLRHMVANHRGFAAAARGEPTRPEVWQDADLGDDPAAAYKIAAEDVVEAFAADGVLDRPLEVYGYGVFPGRSAIRMHFVDYLVHGWDVARSLGDPGVLDPELAQAGLAIALRWPYQRPDKAFGVKVEVPGSAPAADRLIAYLGRSPAWPS
jgi:uncharacterized protein (TIGR03086 family)